MISVIIPVYNAESTLAATLDSLISQSLSDYEILLIDNKSTDGTFDLIDRYCQISNRIHFFSGHDKGIYDAMNKGIIQANGEWLYFMGSDDCLYNDNVLSKLSEYLNDDCDLIYGDCLWVPDNILESGEWQLKNILLQSINHQRILYRKDLFVKYGNYELQYKISSDHSLNIRFFCNSSIRKKYVPVLIAKYNTTGFSSGKLDETFWKNWRKTILEPFKGQIPDKEIYKSLYSFYIYNLNRKKYLTAAGLLFKMNLKSFSPGFFLLTVKTFFLSFFKKIGQ